MDLAKQNLHLHIQNAMLMQQFNNYAASVNIHIANLESKILKPSDINKIVEEKLKPKMQVFEDHRVAAITELRKIKELNNGN